MTIPPPTHAAAEAFQRLIPGAPGILPRKMFGQPAAFVDGKLFLGVFGDDVFVRLSPDDEADARKLPGARPFEPVRGRAMSGYVVLPKAIASNPGAAAPWVKKALLFARSLPKKEGKNSKAR